MAVGDIINYRDKNSKFVTIEGPDGDPYLALLIADSKQADPLAVTRVKVLENEGPAIEHFMWEELNTVVIAGAIARNTDVIDLEPGHNFLNPVGLDIDYFNVHYVTPGDPSFIGTRFSQHAVTKVTVDQIEIVPPIAYDLDPANVEFSKRVNVNMSVVGTRAAKIPFLSYPPNGTKWEMRRFMPSMVLSSAGDDGLFGNIPALTNGQYFGFENPLFAEYNVFIFDNGDYASSAYDTKYPLRSGGGGSHGFNVRKTVAGLDKNNVVIVLDGATFDRFVTYVQDDTSGIGRYRIKVMGDIG